ncbi:MAG: diguanylate cyclase [Candidatus Omnitrophica bacterium]|nr:diguanylate cyclase [Candidatus Omnitrophota bacterium]
MKTIKNISINFAISLVVFILLFLISQGPFFDKLEYFASDTFFSLRGPQEKNVPIIIIQIADEDIAKVGRWPWKRLWHAAITKVLFELGAESIYFDMIFSEPSDERDDKLFQAAMSAAGNVYLPYVFSSKDYLIGEALLPIKKLSENIKGMGAMNVYPDIDGSIREIQLIFTNDKNTYPHIILKMAMDYLNMKLSDVGTKNIIISNDKERIKIPYNHNYSLVVNWKGIWTKSFYHFSFVDVLAEYQKYMDKEPTTIDLSLFKDSICLVGVTAFGLYDIKPIPIQPEYPGVGVIANGIYTIISKNFIRDSSVYINLALLFLMTIIPAFFLLGKKPLLETMLVLLSVVLYVVLLYVVFLKNYRLIITTPLLGTLISSICVGFYNFVITSGEKQNLFSMAITDGLTGLSNIRYFKMLLDTEIKKFRSGMAKPFVVTLSDIDHFKKFNDKYGHQVGDKVLKEVAKTLQNSVRTTDVVARYGGEEMIILLRGSDLKMGLTITEKMRNNLENSNIQDGANTYSVTASFGVASIKPGDTLDSLIKRADDALYKSKEDGRNCVRTLENI